MIQKNAPSPPLLKNVLWAFFVGGAICVIGQAVQNYIMATWDLSTKEAAGPTAAVMVFLGAFFTGLGIYDELGQRAGAGSIVPITGFANSIVAPAMEFKREGYVFGVGAKMFVIAGPVIVYGTVTAVIIGIVRYLIG
jgi:stage V sporulation protein AC